MPGNASDFLEGALINATLRGVNFTAPTNIFVSLHTAPPTDANTTSTEVTTAIWAGYARVNAAGGGAVATGWSAPSNGTTSNALLLTFPAQGSAAAVTVTHFGLYDAATGGNLLYWVPMTTAKTMNQTDKLSFDIGQITVSID